MTKTTKKPAPRRRKTQETNTMAKLANFDTYTAGAQQAFTAQSAQFSETSKEFADFAKANLDAVFASAASATENSNKIMTALLSFAQASTNTSTAAFKELAKAKDLAEFSEKQATLTKASVQAFAEQAQKLHEMSVAATEECVAPLKTRFAAFGDFVKTAARN